MIKETFFFSHDYNARTDEKIKRLVRKHGMEGYGIFWAIVEDLYNNANALRTDYEGIAYELHTHEATVKSVIFDFDLFIIEGEIFGSSSIEKRLTERNCKSEKARQSAFKRWGNRKSDANALPKQSDSNAIYNTIENNTIKNNTDLISETFEIFRKQYPGTKGGHKTEFDNFSKKNEPEIVNLLLPALEKEKTYHSKLAEAKKLVPDWKNLSTWINKRCWEQEFPEIESFLNAQQIQHSKSGATIQPIYQ